MNDKVKQYDSYSEHNREGGMYIIKEVVQRAYTLVYLTGKATVTHYGGNGRFKFTLDGAEDVFNTIFVKDICTNQENHGANKRDDQYFDYSQVQFNIDPREGWRNTYIEADKKGQYWIPAPALTEA